MKKDNKEEYDSKYSEEELKQLESQKQEAEKLAEMQRQLQESAQKGQEVAQGDGTSEEDRLAISKQREQEAMEELNPSYYPSQITRSAGYKFAD